MIRDKYLITEDYKAASIELLVDNLPSLRARIGITQEELASVLGISRQSYYAFELGKRKMSWALFLATVLIFDSVKSTSEMLRDLRIYPIDLFMVFNEEMDTPFFGRANEKAGEDVWKT